MPDNEWVHRWEDRQPSSDENEEIANMAVILTSGLGRMIVGDIVYMTGGAGIITFDDVNF